MRKNTMRRALCVAASLIVGIVLMAPASSAATQASTDEARLAAAGVDVDKLRPGWALVGDEVWWDGGDIRRSLGPTDESCPAGWVCFYDEPGLRGFWLRGSASGFYWNMPDYDFNDMMESWINRSSYRDARWYHNVSGTPNTNRCVGNGRKMEHLNPATDNNKMSALYIYNSSTVC